MVKLYIPKLIRSTHIVVNNSNKYTICLEKMYEDSLYELKINSYTIKGIYIATVYHNHKRNERFEGVIRKEG